MVPENFEAISRSAKLPSNLEVIHTNRLLISNCSVMDLGIQQTCLVHD